MDNRDIIQQIIDDVTAARTSGTEAINADNLLKYLEGMRESQIYKHDVQMELLKTNNQASIEIMKLNHAAELEAFRSVITVGANASRAFMVINGGAAIALLAFLGNIWNKSSTPEATSAIACSLLIFCLGVLASGVCSGFTYLAQFSTASSGLNSKKGWFYSAVCFNVIAVIAGATSLGLFGYGAYATYTSMGSQFG